MFRATPEQTEIVKFDYMPDQTLTLTLDYFDRVATPSGDAKVSSLTEGDQLLFKEGLQDVIGCVKTIRCVENSPQRVIEVSILDQQGDKV